MDNLVSVLIPCYNAEQYLDRSIGSVYSQNYPNVELIVVNDGSTDNSESKILSWKKLFAEKGFALKYIYQDNQGQGKAVDTGLKLVTGKYLTLLDADDSFLPESIGLRAQFLDTHPECAGVRSNGWMVTGKDKQLFITDEMEKNITDLFAALMNGQTNNWAGTFMVKTDILFAFYPDRSIYPSRYGQNLQIILPVAYRRLFGYVDKPLMEYYIRTNSHSHFSEDAYEKNERNAHGYQDIYEHMLKQVVTDSEEYKQYHHIIETCFHRAGMLRAVQYNQTAAMEKYFRKLKELNAVTLDDRVVYYKKKNPAFALLLRCIRKCVCLIKKGRAKC